MAAPRLQPDTCDVLVVGGGVAGWMAAYASIRSGCSTLLVERSPRLGGKATNAMVGTICGAFLRTVEGGAQWAVRSPVRDMVKSIADRSGTRPERGERGLWYVPYGVECMEEVLSSKEYGVVQRAMLKAILRDQGTERVLVAKAVVDATGNALITRLCGGEMITEERYQAPSQVVHVNGVREMTPEAMDLVLGRAVSRAKSSGDDRVAEVKHVGIVHGSMCAGTVALKVTLAQRITGNEEPGTLSGSGRAVALGVVHLLRETTEAFANAEVVVMASELGVRTEQRPLGREVLTEDQVLSAAKPLNGVAVGAWPIEHWGDGPGAEMKWMPDGEHYLIPAGALRSTAIDSLFFAGRGISATEMAVASARVMGTCLATGYSAGIMAAHHALDRSEEEAIAVLRHEQLP
jgi:FAD dependent oxidoreductase